MSSESEYWVVLPSNTRSSVEDTKNQADDFKTALNPPLDLVGDWEEGLFKVSYAKTCFDIKLNEADTAPSDSDKTKAKGIFSDDHDDYTVTSRAPEVPSTWTDDNACKTTRHHLSWENYEINDSSIFVEVYQSISLPRGSNTLAGTSTPLYRSQYMRTLAHVHLGDLHTSRSAQDVADQLNHSFKNNLLHNCS